MTNVGLENFPEIPSCSEGASKYLCPWICVLRETQHIQGQEEARTPPLKNITVITYTENAGAINVLGGHFVYHYFLNLFESGNSQGVRGGGRGGVGGGYFLLCIEGEGVLSSEATWLSSNPSG